MTLRHLRIVGFVGLLSLVWASNPANRRLGQNQGLRHRAVNDPKYTSFDDEEKELDPYRLWAYAMKKEYSNAILYAQRLYIHIDDSDDNSNNDDQQCDRLRNKVLTRWLVLVKSDRLY